LSSSSPNNGGQRKTAGPIDGKASPSHRAPEFLSGGGKLAALMGAIDWSRTPVGPIEGWPQSLRMMVSFVLANRFPLLLWWGPQFCQFYNDACQPLLGAKHPRSMGQPASECWSEIWHITGPLIETPFTGGPATLIDDIVLELDRHGAVEEAHFTITYSPVPDETAPRGIGGVLATMHEITDGLLAERRSAALRDLGRQAGEAKTVEEACAGATDILANHPKEVPFALLYLIDPAGTPGWQARQGWPRAKPRARSSSISGPRKPPMAAGRWPKPSAAR
jgi:hypothetical protein